MTTVIVPRIIAAAYIEAACDNNNVPDTSAIRYADEVYEELIDQKKLINEDFIKKTSKIDTVAYKNQYSLPTDFERMTQISIKFTAPSYTARAAWTDYITWDKISNAWLAYISKTNHTAWATFSWDSANWEQIYEWYIPCTPRSVDFDFQKDFNSISESSPVYFYENNNLNIYPRPKEVVKEWIYFDYIPAQPTLTTTTDDATIYIEKKLEKAWILWTAKRFVDHMKKDSSKLDFDYQRATNRCLEQWRWRHYAPIKQQLPTSLLRYMR